MDINGAIAIGDLTQTKTYHVEVHSALHSLVSVRREPLDIAHPIQCSCRSEGARLDDCRQTGSACVSTLQAGFVVYGLVLAGLTRICVMHLAFVGLAVRLSRTYSLRGGGGTVGHDAETRPGLWHRVTSESTWR